METDPTAAASESAPATMTVAEPEAPPAPPPADFAQVQQMVENGVKAVEAGHKVGEHMFHKQFHPVLGDVGVLDHHGFKAWRAAHSEGCDPAELDAVEARAIVDPDVETAEDKAEREAKERAEESPEAKADREAWELSTGRTTHFATPAADPAPGESVVAPATEG